MPGWATAPPVPTRVFGGRPLLWPLLLESLKAYRLRLLAVVVCQLAQSAASLLLPSLNAAIIDDGIVRGETGAILSLGAAMLGLTLVQIAFAVGAVYFAARVAMGVGRDLRSRVFRRVGTFSERELNRFGSATLITRCTNDVQQVQMLVLTGCTMLVTAPILSVGGVVLALQQDVALSAVLVVAIPVLLGSVTAVITRMVPLFQQMQTRIDAVNGSLREQLTGVRTIRAFVREPQEEQRFEDANQPLYPTSLHSGRLFALVFPIVQLVLNLSSVAVLWFGAQRIGAGAMQVGALTAFLTYLTQILMAVTMATFVVILLPRAAVSGRRIQEVLRTTSSLPVPADPVRDLGGGTVAVHDVTFSYPGADRPVLEGASFAAAAGVTAIVGATGSGKSTLLGLIPRLYDPDRGSVEVGGVDVRAADPAVLHRRVGYVPQRSYLFGGTIASNLRFADDAATDEDLWAALRTAQADDFVRSLPGGLDAAVAQGGTNLSGGQRQRIAIARALVGGAGILLFDDSFSALDTETDARLRAALRRDRPDATFVIVAQRISTIESADLIVVIEHGRITAQGTHADLLARSATYADIVGSQLPAGTPA